MTHDDLKRSAYAHRQDSNAARNARHILMILLAKWSDPVEILSFARAEASNKIVREHIDEIANRAERGEPSLTARENGATEAMRARRLIRRRQ